MNLVLLTIPAVRPQQFADDRANSCWQQSVAMLLAMAVPAILQRQHRYFSWTWPFASTK